VIASGLQDSGQVTGEAAYAGPVGFITKSASGPSRSETRAIKFDPSDSGSPFAVHPAHRETITNAIKVQRR
jgi:hypothetical protein